MKRLRFTGFFGWFFIPMLCILLFCSSGICPPQETEELAPGRKMARQATKQKPFLIVHVYMTTTDHTISEHIAAMWSGWEEVEDGAKIEDWEKAKVRS